MGYSRRGYVAAGVVIVATASLLAACASPSRTAAKPAAASTQHTTPTSRPAASPSSTPISTPTPGTAATGADGVPRFDHIIVVIEENKPYGELVGTSSTAFLTALAGSGAVLTQSYAITHPSEPNYLALFSGSTQGLSSDSCPHQFSGPNLAASLVAAGDTFTGYSESLPSPGYTGCSAGTYARKHAPWVNFALPPGTSQPLTAFPTDFSQLPNLSFVIPNLQDDMHDGSIAQGDQWLSTHLGPYLTWAATHNSLLVVTTDEDDNSHANHITTILAGAHIAPGQYPTRTDHYGLLHTLLDSFNLAPFGGAASTPAISGIWGS
jgi:phosphatidylinositol-3-phosphatase